MKSCIVVFPLYKQPDAIEISFLENGMHQTAGFKQVIIAPEGLKIDRSFGKLEQLEVKRFSTHYFESVQGYNQLLLSKGFYRAFALFDYILIHQADVFLFKNELQFWCDKGYDYIGAPWFRPDKLNMSFFSTRIDQLKRSLQSNKLYANRHNKTGNGGLSLRRVQSALQVLDQINPELVKRYSQLNSSEYNEDVFWSLQVPTLFPAYRIPELRESLAFAMEFNAPAAYQFLGEQLPFGCHAPLKHHPEFWKKFIPHI